MAKYEKFWAGYSDDKLHVWNEVWKDAKTGREHSHKRVAIFVRLADARREYKDVRPLVFKI